MITVYLIVFIINAIIVYLVRNSHFTFDHEAMQFSLIIWILYGIVMLIPIVNIIASVICAYFLVRFYIEGEIEFNKDFWLNQKY